MIWRNRIFSFHFIRCILIVLRINAFTVFSWLRPCVLFHIPQAVFVWCVASEADIFVYAEPECMCHMRHFLCVGVCHFRNRNLTFERFQIEFMKHLVPVHPDSRTFARDSCWKSIVVYQSQVHHNCSYSESSWIRFASISLIFSRFLTSSAFEGLSSEFRSIAQSQQKSTNDGS